MKACVSLLLYALLLASSTTAVDEDEISQWSWHQKYIGRVKHAVFLTTPKGKKQVIVATEQNVVAALNLRNGEIIWRQLLGEADRIDGLELAYEKYAITFSGGYIMKAWDIVNGHLVWETNVSTVPSRPILDVTPIEIHHLKARLILVYGGSIVHAVSSSSGDVLWTTNTWSASEGGMFSLKKVLSGDDQNSLYGVGFTGTSGFSVWKFYLFTGRLVFQEAATIKGTLCTDELIVTGHTVVALDCEGKTIFTGHIGPQRSFSIRKTFVHNIIPDALGKARLLKATLHGVFTLRFADQIVFVKISSSDQSLEVIEKLECPAILSNTIKLPLNKTALLVVQHVGPPEDRQVALRVIAREGDNENVSSHVLELDPERGFVQRVFLSSYVRKDGSYGYRSLIVAEDYSLSLVQQGEFLWSREDGLADILDAGSVELPNEVTIQRKDHGFGAWFKKHPFWNALFYVRRGTLRSRNDRLEMTMTGDDAGLRKLIIVLTKGGKLIALHSSTGGAVWEIG